MDNVFGTTNIRKCPICREATDKLNIHLKRSHEEKEIETAILGDKNRGMSDVEIGKKYWITYRQPLIKLDGRRATGQCGGERGISCG